MNDKQEVTVTIYPWMSKLGLYSSELVAYALIYNSEPEFDGYYRDVARWCGITKRSALRVLRTLVDMGLITKHDEYINNIKHCRFRAVRKEV